MTINNPTPITPLPMTGMWASNFRLQLPNLSMPMSSYLYHGQFFATLNPYDGTHLLRTGTKVVQITDLISKRQTDPIFDSVITSVVLEIERQANKTDLSSITVMAYDPEYPVRIIAEFSNRAKYNILDCYKLCATDSVFAGVFQSALEEVARQAGLTIS